MAARERARRHAHDPRSCTRTRGGAIVGLILAFESGLGKPQPRANAGWPLGASGVQRHADNPRGLLASERQCAHRPHRASQAARDDCRRRGGGSSLRRNRDMANASRERTRPGPSATRECNATRITREGSWPPSAGITTHAPKRGRGRAHPVPLPHSAQRRAVSRDAGGRADEVAPRAAVVPPVTGGARQRPSRCHVQCPTHACCRRHPGRRRHGACRRCRAAPRPTRGSRIGPCDVLEGPARRSSRAAGRLLKPSLPPDFRVSK